MNSHLPHQQKSAGDPPLVSDQAIAKLSGVLAQQFLQEKQKQKYAPVKQVLILLGYGAVLSAAILAPHSLAAFAPLFKKERDWERWKRYNLSYLRRTLKQLEKQKQVQINIVNGEPMIQLTQQGKRKILKFSLDSLFVDKPKRWDNRWRLVLYDIPQDQNHTRDLLHDALKSIGFLAIQKSVYLIPYPCFEQIEFLREYYGIGNKLQYMLVYQIENDAAYKTYFGLS